MTLSISWNDPSTVATLTLERPRVHNALDGETLDRLEEAVLAADRAGARILVLRGAGPSFCSGADRRNYPGYRREEDREAVIQHAIRIGNRVCGALARTGALTIARLHGHVLGGGLALALACDVRLVADEATLGLPEIELSVPLGWGALYRLVAATGSTRAWEMLIAGRRLTGTEAVQWGLCGESAPETGLDALLDRRIERALSLDPRALMLTKAQFRAVAARASQGDLEQFDGPLLLASLTGPGAGSAFHA
jgi:enoyl-CoA hydratase/carnithine racemase